MFCADGWEIIPGALFILAFGNVECAVGVGRLVCGLTVPPCALCFTPVVKCVCVACDLSADAEDWACATRPSFLAPSKQNLYPMTTLGRTCTWAVFETLAESLSLTLGSAAGFSQGIRSDYSNLSRVRFSAKDTHASIGRESRTCLGLVKRKKGKSGRTS